MWKLRSHLYTVLLRATATDLVFIMLRIISQVLIHFSDQTIDLLFPVSAIASFNKVVGDVSEPSLGAAQLKRPQEVVDLFEGGTDCQDLVNDILNTDDTMLAKNLLDNGVVGEGNTLLLNFAVTTFVDQLTDCLQVRIPEIQWHLS